MLQRAAQARAFPSMAATSVCQTTSSNWPSPFSRIAWWPARANASLQKKIRDTEAVLREIVDP